MNIKFVKVFIVCSASVALSAFLFLATLGTGSPAPISRTKVISNDIAIALMVLADTSGIRTEKKSTAPNSPAELVFSQLKEKLPDLPVCDTDRDGMPEFADAYGNPLIILLTSHQVVMKDKCGREFKVKLEGIEPGKTFALWSMGPNGINDYGQGDDIGWTCVRVENGKVSEKGVLGIKWIPENSK